MCTRSSSTEPWTSPLYFRVLVKTSINMNEDMA